MQFPPQKKRKFPPTDKSKYCKFHKNYVRDTNNCVTLRDEIETLIRKRKLIKYKLYRRQEKEKIKERE